MGEYNNQKNATLIEKLTWAFSAQNYEIPI
jgi:hypothetical protein